MELSDYDLLGIHKDASFRIVKNAYYELSRIYHPDSTQIVIGLKKEDRLIAFKRIQTAYENIKKKLNVVEIDMPDCEIEYNTRQCELPVIERNIDLSVSEKIDFNKKFNEQFEKINKKENIDNPYSIHYKEPEEIKRNLNDTQLILKEAEFKTNPYEFGINYVEDHSSDKYIDIRNLKIDDEDENSNSKDKRVVQLKLLKRIVDEFFR